MKLFFATSLTSLVLMGGLTSVQAQSLPPLEQLQSSRACQKCDLSNANLAGLDLSNTDLSGAVLSNAELSGANLSGANLTGANLYLAKLSNANLKGANLSQANLKGAILQSADLGGSNLTDADLSYAKLMGANFSQANLSQAKLDNAQLAGANLTEAKLIGANLGYADLTEANVERTDFSNANLSAANLTNAIKLETANLAGTTLTGANLLGAKLPDSEIASTATGTPKSSASSANGDRISLGETKFSAKDSPLAHMSFQRPTAEHLRKGEVVIDATARTFFTSSFSAQGTKSEGTPFWPSAGIRWGITNNSELTVAFQNFDPVSIERQGAFNPIVIDKTPTWDFAVEFKQRIWENSAKTLSLSGVASLAGFTEPSFAWQGTGLGGVTREGNGIVPGLAFPFTAKVNDRLSVTVSPTFAFFPSDSALFLHVLPLPNSGSFGTNFGLTGAVSFQLHPRLLLWGDAYIPFAGNNSLNSVTGLPTKTLAFNAGFRYLLNPRVGLDLFATNTFGTFGPVSLTADRDNIGVGAGLVFMPNAIPANRRSYPNNFKGQFQEKDTPLTTDGLGFFDGGTVPARKLLAQFQAGNNGTMFALRYGVTKDLEIGTYLDYVFGKVDESEQGISAKLRFLNQANGAPFTASVVATLGQANQLIFNLTNNNASFFENSGNEKSIPFLFSGGLAGGDALFVASVSAPLHYEFSPGTAVWFTPTLGFVQRSGVAVAGVNVGGAFRIFKDVSLIGEVAVNVGGEGNTFINNRLVDRIPWNFAVRWQPATLLGLDFKDALARPSLELFLTNRVGASAFQQLRVREGNDPAIGVGFSFPF
jgi:uncharacterized protein YjbI with pentapeptide repeats